MERTVSQQDPEETLVRAYLSWRPFPNLSEVFDEKGRFRYDFQNSPEYKGLVDALQGRSCFSASLLFPGNDSDAFRYTVGFSEGQMFLRDAGKTKALNPAFEEEQYSFPF